MSAYIVYAVAPNGRKFVSGVAVVLGDTAISWKRGTQKCVTTATCEAEYVTLCDAAKEAIFKIYIFFAAAVTGRDVC